MADAQDLSAPLVTPVEHAYPVASPFSARLTSDSGELSALWQALEADPATTFHQRRVWAEAWSQGTGTVLQLVTLERNGVAFALLPLEISLAGGLKVARFAGTAYSNENTGLIDTQCQGGLEPVSSSDLAAALSQAGLAADIVVFDKMTTEAAGRPPFSSLPRVLHQNPSFQLPLFEDFNAVLAQINGKRRRKKFRVSERRLEAMGGYTHIIAKTDTEAIRLLETFFAQKGVRLAAQGLPDVFADPGIRAFFRQLATTRDSDGNTALELHGIELSGGDHAGEIISVAGLTIKDHHVTCQFGSINEEIAADVSAGELLFFRMIERASAAGHTVFDFGVGDQPYKRSWCPQRTELMDCYCPLNAKGRLAAPLIAGLIRLKRMIKTSPLLHRLASRLRGGLMVKAKPAAEVD
ncbi:CelD/BcsL family acetyltransferase involved in cellulose biosynthesis [Hoeflea halophila]|uniref:CelD/BcsL family acetyltransferase involved in cellulose biosynthesis n=1 Tax=Hoeflea halophila TaxID=714899 RepID=A0A286IB29_9HYPH|nr:GNAT family N-acetyltransferase [Hoeflea halophila]SOE17328.1 CelD/BcsL family acetyltransferase involved in cellulose biosynthesis [Hoeflea halophila]